MGARRNSGVPLAMSIAHRLVKVHCVFPHEVHVFYEARKCVAGCVEFLFMVDQRRMRKRRIAAQGVPLSTAICSTRGKSPC